MTDEPAAPAKRRIHFDPSIRLDNAISAVVMLVMIVTGWVTLSMKVEFQADKLTTVEKQLTDRIKANESVAARFDLNYREDMRDVKALLSRIDDKLDRKADKPGR